MPLSELDNVLYHAGVEMVDRVGSPGLVEETLPSVLLEPLKPIV